MKRGKRNCQSAVIVSSRDFRYRGTPGESSQAVPLTPQQCLNVPPRMPSMWRSESPRADFAHLSMGPLMPSKASFLVYDIIKAGTPPPLSYRHVKPKSISSGPWPQGIAKYCESILGLANRNAMTKLIVSQAAGSYSPPVQPGLPYLPPFGDQ
jgi:hypothetical protein